jgi:peroxiredoxin
MSQFSLKYALCWGVAVIFLLSLTGCSSKKKTPNKSAESKNNLPHDPYSASLHAASKRIKAPDFTAKLLNGKIFHLSSHRGEVVLLNIWATWCAPCREETPELVNLYKKYKNKEVEFLGISVDKQGESVVRPFVDKYDIPYPITIDDGHIMKKYGPVTGYPTTYIIGPKGDLRYFAAGAVTEKEVRPRLDKLLGERGTNEKQEVKSEKQE